MKCLLNNSTLNPQTNLSSDKTQTLKCNLNYWQSLLPPNIIFLLHGFSLLLLMVYKYQTLRLSGHWRSSILKGGTMRLESSCFTSLVCFSHLWKGDKISKTYRGSRYRGKNTRPRFQPWLYHKYAVWPWVILSPHCAPWKSAGSTISEATFQR